MSKQVINPPELFDSVQFGFSQIVVSPPGGRLVHMSGQVAWDERRAIVGRGDLRAQVMQSLRNVETGLRLAGGTLADIVALRIYIKYSHMGESGAVREGLQHFFGAEPPCATWIGVQGLANEEFLVEIEPIAVVHERSAGQASGLPVVS